MRYGQYVTMRRAHVPASQDCPRCGGLVCRDRANDLDDAVDWFAGQCLICARMFAVTESGSFELWIRPMAA